MPFGRFNHRWTVGEEQRLAELIVHRWSPLVVADLLERTEGAVVTRAAKIRGRFDLSDMLFGRPTWWESECWDEFLSGWTFLDGVWRRYR